MKMNHKVYIVRYDNIIVRGTMETRINKFLSEAGVCSRRAADALIEEGRVKVDDVVAVTGTKVSEGQHVFVDGKEIFKVNQKVLIAFHKPVGIVCTAQKREKNNVIDFIHHKERIFPIGRLDKDSEGLLLLTNDGELMNQILKAANGHEKEYLVTVDKDFDEAFLKGMGAGVPILGRITSPCYVERVRERVFRIILTQGLNRQIRRMCEYFGYRVVKLKRVRIMNIMLGDLKVGTYRDVTKEEQLKMYQLMEGNRKES